MDEKNIYEILNTSQKDLDERSPETHDAYLIRKKDELISYYSRLLEMAESFSEKEKRKTQIAEVEEAYEKVSTAEKRARYSAKIRAEKRAKEIREKYSHMSECRLDIISDKSEKKSEPFESNFENKCVRRMPKNRPEEIYLEDDENRNLIIRNTAIIEFESSFKVKQMYIGEYEVTRTINGEEVTDKIYTNLQLTQLDFDDNTGRPINEEYYRCVANDLLSEDMIEGSKCNYGYIGSIILNDESKKYETTLGKEKLEGLEETEALAAAVIQRRKEQKEEEKNHPEWQGR